MILLKLAGPEAIEKSTLLMYLTERDNAGDAGNKLPAETKFQVEALKEGSKRYAASSPT